MGPPLHLISLTTYQDAPKGEKPSTGNRNGLAQKEANRI